MKNMNKSTSTIVNRPELQRKGYVPKRCTNVCKNVQLVLTFGAK